MLLFQYGVSLTLLSLWAGARGLESGERQVYGIPGTPLLLDRGRSALPQHEIYSLTWKREGQYSRRILQYVLVSDRVYPARSYRNRIRFHKENGTLVLLSFGSEDVGLYCLTVTDVGGSELTSCIRVLLYEQVSELAIEVSRNPTNVTFSCSARNGTEVRYHWLKDGEDLSVTNDTLISDDGHQLLLTSMDPVLCGIYTCLVTNKLGQTLVNKTISGSEGFEQCTQVRKGRGVQTRLRMIGFSVILVLVAGVFLMVLQSQSSGL
ncbi:HEPACAM family member 2 isoform X2 [Hemiscyllium ocellatum]|uniref:HEPACAM family member 2 isoform X2 n=1 Tax=Hemiscyllium ocellatum TaxID=170820 RepID=UPI002966B11D|nr:HEPACAM family member 2 isoform X2 [Hemiscyllium ocellatum]